MIQESLIKRCVKKVTDNLDVKITYGKLSTVILVLTISGASLAGLAKLLITASDIAGTEKCGKVPHGNGCVINWCYYGMLKGIYWRYMGVCTHPCTQEAEAVFNESGCGAVEHCLQNLMTKISKHEEYKTHEEHKKQKEHIKCEEHNKHEEHKKHEEL
ncbi:uncharacterized protein LOC128556201 [Mercenaria mercenaria]|uniref:uncharacterized protein LOC128556201 n=1 Tax=Mercenaria mercenaria TaxID=6596 RepID=UPI00234E58F2|nr:uncharacterized protein LOC128556201 [Mercenaria mercenaria]